MAYLVHCNTQTEYRKNKTANSVGQSSEVYFEELGYWITADPMSPREQLVLNGAVSTTGAYVTTSNGHYTLKSFSLAR